MKQSKQHGRRRDGQEPGRRGMLPRDSRPTKPLPGEPAHHHAAVPPFSGPSKGSIRPQTGGRDVRRVKAPFDPASSRPREGSGGDRPDQEPVAPARSAARASSTCGSGSGWRATGSRSSTATWSTAR
jgi:hypothetical protein